MLTTKERLLQRGPFFHEILKAAKMGLAEEGEHQPCGGRGGRWGEGYVIEERIAI